MKDIKIVPSRLVLFIWTLGVVTTYIIGLVTASDFVLNVVAVWLTLVFMCAFIIYHNEESVPKEPGITKFAVFIYTTCTAMFVTRRTYAIIIHNPSELTKPEALFAKVAIFACMWIITVVAVICVAKISTYATKKINSFINKHGNSPK